MSQAVPNWNGHQSVADKGKGGKPEHDFIFLREAIEGGSLDRDGGIRKGDSLVPAARTAVNKQNIPATTEQPFRSLTNSALNQFLVGEHGFISRGGVVDFRGVWLVVNTYQTRLTRFH